MISAIELRREWNQAIINNLCCEVTDGDMSEMLDCFNRRIQDMEHVLAGIEPEVENRILCNNCELLYEIREDKAHFIV